MVLNEPVLIIVVRNFPGVPYQRRSDRSAVIAMVVALQDTIINGIERQDIVYAESIGPVVGKACNRDEEPACIQ